MFFTAIIGNIPVISLIDTGATHSCIPSDSEDMLQELGYTIRPIELSATVANGGSAPITGVATITVTLGNFSTWTGDVFLMKHLPFPLLLGTNTLDALNAKIDVKHNKLSLTSANGTELIQGVSVPKSSVISKQKGKVSVNPLTFEDGTTVNLESSHDDDSNEDQEECYDTEDPVPPEDFSKNPSMKNLELSHPDVSVDQQQNFNEFLRSWKEKFKLSPGLTTVSECKIYVDPNTPPIKQRSIRMSLADQQLAEAEIQRLLDLDIIEPSVSDWCSPAFLVNKKGGSKRLVVNYKALNSVMKKNSAPIPRIDECLKILQESRFVSTLDLQQGFYQMKMSEDSKHYTAFCLPPSHFYQFKRLPFGLTNSPAVFQAMIQKVLRPLLFKTCFVYIDDLLITSKSYEEHVKNLNEVFELLFQAGLAINWDKCKFLKHETEFLGYCVGSGKIKAAASKLGAVRDFPRPKTVRQLRRFLGMVGWFRNFIPFLSDKSTCLNELLKKDQPFKWSSECQNAFEELKECLVNPPVLTVPDPTLPYEIHTDASDSGIGAVLLQRKNGVAQVVAFASRSLSKHERNYPVTQKECLALIWAVEKWKHFILGHSTTHCYTDHASLVWLAGLKAPTGRLARWVCRLSEFDLKIIHKKGKLNLVPDCLSRTFDINAATVDVANFTNTSDPWFLNLRQRIIDNPDSFPSFRVKLPHILKYVRHPVTGIVEERYVVPSDCREALLKLYHSDITSGHIGIAKTFHKLADRFYFPKMRQEIKKFVTSCHVCQQYKISNLGPAGHMSIRDPVLKPFSMVCADLAGPLPMSPEKFRYILVIVDLATKFVIAKPLRTATASSITKVFQEDLVLIHGCPQVIITDNASQFSGHEFQNFCASVNAKSHLIPKHFPSANPCERYIKTLKTMVAMFAKDDHRNWAKNLPYLVFAMNTSKNETTQFTPSKLVYGRELRSPYELAADVQDGDTSPFDPLTYNNELQGSLKKIFAHVRSAASKAMATQAKTYNLRRRVVDDEFPVGCLVWKKNFPQSSAGDRIAAKLQEKYVGPFTVTHVWSPTQVELADLTGKSRGRWHVTHLRRVSGDVISN